MASRALDQSPLIGHLLGHYRIVAKIGAGGMGEVYRGRDEHLDRDVAIKVLPSSTFSNESARKHFRKEALALSRLNHPNIAAVYDFDTQQGIDFLVMEYVPGITLDTKRSERLQEKELARLGVQLAEGLAVAHEQGVIHRDLKPGNLRLTPDGRVKILDFGIAKLVKPISPESETETQTQNLAGTLPYMSPEQLQGEAADERSDIWAAGLVLYELASGQPAFANRSGALLLTAILQEPPAPPSACNPRLSPVLDGILLKCLEKDRNNRYQSAKELAVDLRRLASQTVPTTMPPSKRSTRPTKLFWGGTAIVALLVIVVVTRVLVTHFSAAPPVIRSLAVLPLENLPHDPAQDYFADGMTEALITDLSKLSALRVISRTSVSQYKGTMKPVSQIASELKVDAVIEGSVLRVGDRVRITAQLIGAAPERHLWADSYDRDMRDILALQSEVAQAIAREIRIKLTPEQQASLANARPVVPEAHEAFLRGRYLATIWSPESVERAKVYLQQAIEKDPTYAPAYAELAHANIKLCSLGAVPPPEIRQVLSSARENAWKAVELDPTLPQAHMVVAMTSVILDRNWELSRAETHRALELGPNSADVLTHAALGMVWRGYKQEAIAAVNHALELEPLNQEVNLVAGEVFWTAREYDRALTELERAIEQAPNLAELHWMLGNVYESKEMYPEAVATYQKGMTLSGAPPEQVNALGRVFAQQGIRGVRLWRLQRLEAAAKKGNDDPVARAAAFAALGEKDKAFQLLEKADKEYEPRNFDLFTINASPRFDPLRSDPRFNELVQRLGLEQ